MRSILCWLGVWPDGFLGIQSWRAGELESWSRRLAGMKPVAYSPHAEEEA